jgi:hypothetical protein
MSEPGIFDDLEALGRNVGRCEPIKAERTLARAACSHCSGERVGIVRSPDNVHLVWKIHYFRTHANLELPCGAGGQYLCAARPRVTPGYDTPACTHS